MSPSSNLPQRTSITRRCQGPEVTTFPGGCVVKNEKSSEWRAALYEARRLYEARHGEDLTYTEIGVQVAKLLRRRTPVSKQQVASWFAGVVPNFSLGVALATVLQVDPVAIGLPQGEEGAATPEPVTSDFKPSKGPSPTRKKVGGATGKKRRTG